ncbi:MAG: hypothetical protein ACLRSW_10390 [Christensenellaceae bacterium]
MAARATAETKGRQRRPRRARHHYAREFGAPLATVNVTNEYGFYYNQTLNNYYEHMGIDMSAEAGAEVFAARTGTIESIYTSDVLVVRRSSSTTATGSRAFTST